MLELFYGKDNIPKSLTVIHPATHFTHLSSAEYNFYNEDPIALYIRSQLKERENLDWRWAIHDVTSTSLSMKAALMAYYFREYKNIAVDLTECSESALAILAEVATGNIKGYINAPIPIPVTSSKIRFNGKKTSIRKVSKKISGRRYYKATAHPPHPFTHFDIRLESDPYEVNGHKERFIFEMTVKRQVTFVENTNLDVVTWLEMLRSFCNFGRYGELSLESTHALDRIIVYGSEALREPQPETYDTDKGQTRQLEELDYTTQDREIWFIGCVDSRSKSEAKLINKLIRNGHTVILFCRAGQYIKAQGGIERATLQTERTAGNASISRIISTTP